MLQQQNSLNIHIDRTSFLMEAYRGRLLGGVWSIQGRRNDCQNALERFDVSGAVVTCRVGNPGTGGGDGEGNRPLAYSFAKISQIVDIRN